MGSLLWSWKPTEVWETLGFYLQGIDNQHKGNSIKEDPVTRCFLLWRPPFSCFLSNHRLPGSTLTFQNRHPNSDSLLQGQNWSCSRTHTATDCLCSGSKITVDSDCSQEIKRHLLLGRRATKNLDKAETSLYWQKCIVKALFFPLSHVQMWSLTIKKAESQRIDDFQLWCWRRLLRIPWTARRSNQSILKEINPEYSLEGLILKLKLQSLDAKNQLTGKDPEAGKDWGQEDKDVTEDEVVGWHHWLNEFEHESDISLSKLWEIVKDREAWHSVVHGVTKSWTRLNDSRTTTSRTHMLHKGPHLQLKLHQEPSPSGVFYPWSGQIR